MKQYIQIQDPSEMTLRFFVRILCGIGMTEETIHGIVAMVGDNQTAMDKVVELIESNPQATESQITKAAWMALQSSSPEK